MSEDISPLNSSDNLESYYDVQRVDNLKKSKENIVYTELTKNIEEQRLKDNKDQTSKIEFFLSKKKQEEEKEASSNPSILDTVYFETNRETFGNLATVLNDAFDMFRQIVEGVANLGGDVAETLQRTREEFETLNVNLNQTKNLNVNPDDATELQTRVRRIGEIVQRGVPEQGYLLENLLDMLQIAGRLNTGFRNRSIINPDEHGGQPRF
ncbi:MAG: hypothetical protein LBJ93_00925 [Clostridiales bacterium]|jgi:methyl-accepting chemotaxis protein|nr:hypothetical protein [Clostridiales bacterium]